MANSNGDILKLAEKVLLGGEIPDEVSREFMVGIAIQTYRKMDALSVEVKNNTRARKFMWAVVIAGGVQIIIQLIP